VKAFEPTVIDEQCEVVSILGDIATKEDGEPQVHAHIVIAKRGAHAFGGHLMEMIINPTAEVIVTETPTHLHKRSVPDYHFATIRLNEST
jgi:predicted DNA-binding protein with PD1-like motif